MQKAGFFFSFWIQIALFWRNRLFVIIFMSHLLFFSFPFLFFFSQILTKKTYPNKMYRLTRFAQHTARPIIRRSNVSPPSMA